MAGYTVPNSKTIKVNVRPNSYVEKSPFETLANNDLKTYITHNWQTLLCELRDDDTTSIQTHRPYRVESPISWIGLAAGNIFKVPYIVPGTNNLLAGTVGDPGGLTVYAKLQDAQLGVRFRTLGSIPNDGTISSPSAWTTVTDENNGPMDWIEFNLDFPSGIMSGDLYQLEVYARRSSESESVGFVAGYIIHERDLQSANP
jgi:hypothetical protein